MKKLSVFLCAMVLVFGLVANSNASLSVIGTASYSNNTFNLIYEDDNIYGGLVWLDLTRGSSAWRTDWLSTLGEEMTVNLFPGYATDIDWSTGWRLPLTDESQCYVFPVPEFGYDGPDASGYHDYRYGFNMVCSEMGHLFL